MGPLSTADMEAGSYPPHPHQQHLPLAGLTAAAAASSAAATSSGAAPSSRSRPSQHKSAMELSMPPPSADATSQGGLPPPHPRLGYERMGPPHGPMPTSAGRDRMGYPPHFPLPVGGGRPTRGPGGGMLAIPGDSIAPTPVQRRRDRPMDPMPPHSGARAPTPSSMGYPTPYSSHRPPPGSEYSVASSSHLGHGDISTPAQPNFDRRDEERGGGNSYPASSQSAHQEGAGPDASPSFYQQYDLPSNFPFYQERDRTWHCKFCASIPPHFRDPQAIWSAPGGGPPPGNFIDYHLSLCRAYQQGFPSPPPGMFQVGPPPAGFGISPYGVPPPHMQSPYGPPAPPGGWETHGGLHPQQLQYPPPHSAAGEGGYYGGPPSHSGIMGHSHLMEGGVGRGYPSSGGQEDPSDYGEQRPGGSDGGGSDNAGPTSQRGSGGGRGSHTVMVGMGSRGGPSNAGRGEPSAESMNHSISYLTQFENEYYTRDAEHRAIPRLVLDEDRLLLTDYFFFLMKQLRLCRFSEADRKTRGGKREKIRIGYGGLQCIHCSDLPMSRKFFWSNVDRLANSFAEIPGHVLKCRRCPQQNKDALLQLKQAHPEQMAKLPRGSQKVFFRRMWRRLHDEDPQGDDDDDAIGGGGVGGGDVRGEGTADQPTISAGAADSATKSPEKGTSPESKKSTDNSPSSGNITISSDDTILVMQRSAKESARALAGTPPQSGQPSPSSRILLAIPEDKEWLSDMDCYIRRQLEVFCANEDDVEAARADRKYPISVGQVGIRCIHCSIAQGNDAIGHAIAYPFSISGIYESVREFHRLHLDSCENLPPTSRAKLANLKGASSLSSVLRKYYILAAKALGLQDTKNGIRSGGESAPIGAQAAFTFADVDDSSPKKEEDDEDRKLPPKTASASNLGTCATTGVMVKEEPEMGDDFAESSKKDSRVGKRSDPPSSVDVSDESKNESKRFRTGASTGDDE